MNDRWFVYFVISLVCMSFTVACLCGAMALEKLDSRIKDLQDIVNEHTNQIAANQDYIETLEKKVDDCEIREQTIIDNILYNW